MPAVALAPIAPSSAFLFASRRVQPLMLAVLCLTIGQLAGVVASCTPELTPQMGMAGRAALSR